jgi:hypothetical protein
MGASGSKQDKSEDGAPDYYQLLGVSEDVSQDEIKVCRINRNYIKMPNPLISESFSETSFAASS